MDFAVRGPGGYRGPSELGPYAVANCRRYLISEGRSLLRAGACSAPRRLLRPKAGLKCVSQELINWTQGRCLVDSVSIFTRPKSRWDTKDAYLRNGEFVDAGRLTNGLAQLYCR